jgi:hypothetical protein
MKTIEETIDDLLEQDDTLSAQGLADLLKAELVEREAEAVERVQLYAERFRLMPQIVSRVLLGVGLGNFDDATKAHIEEQYLAFLEQAKEQTNAQIAAMRAQGVQVPDYTFVDPMTVPLDIDIEVPDTPPEA